MKKISKKCFKTCGRPALTLVEVVTSIVLLSTLLVGVLTAYNRHVRQLGRASDIKQAAKLADQLMGTWFESDDALPVHQTQFFEPDRIYYWQLNEKLGDNSISIGARVLQFSVYKADDDFDQPLLSIELLDSKPDVVEVEQ